MSAPTPGAVAPTDGPPAPRLIPAAQPLPGMPAPPPTDPGLRLSFSRVDTYERCPLKFRFRYIDKLPSRPSPDLSWGSAIHAALEAWWDRKLPEPPPLEVMYRALYDRWDDTGFDGMQREEKLKWYRHARAILARHHELYAPDYLPAVACEQWFELDLGDDVAVCGSIDHIARTPDGGLGVVDWKTNRRAKSRADVAKSLQLAIYALAARELWGKEPEWVALDFVVPGVRVTVERSQIDVEGALGRMRDVAGMIRAEAFDPNPSRLCDWCDYRAVCPAFDGEGPDVPGMAVVELERLRRRQKRDSARIAELEQVVTHYLGEDVAIDEPDDSA
jgi:putative RecB family exonuclease